MITINHPDVAPPADTPGSPDWGRIFSTKNFTGFVYDTQRGERASVGINGERIFHHRAGAVQ
jgi:hypothetical protein